MTARVITISASFGAGGSIVGPAVADRMGVPFIDRAIPAAVAQSLEVPIGRAMAHDEKPANVISRIIAKMGAAAMPYGATPVAGGDPVVDEDVFRSKTEQVIREVSSQQAVILGRAAAIVLAREPGVLHVRLDGPVEARVARISERQQVSVESARQMLEEADGARHAYVRHFYRCDADDARLYHLKIDSTVVPLETCTELIVQAAKASF